LSTGRAPLLDRKAVIDPTLSDLGARAFVGG